MKKRSIKEEWKIFSKEFGIGGYILMFGGAFIIFNSIGILSLGGLMGFFSVVAAYILAEVCFSRIEMRELFEDLNKLIKNGK